MDCSDSDVFDIYFSPFPLFFGSKIQLWCYNIIFSQGTYIGILEVFLCRHYPSIQLQFYSQLTLNDDVNKEEIIEDDKQGMRNAYVTEEDESNEDENTKSDKKSNEMSDHSVYRPIEDLNVLNE